MLVRENLFFSSANFFKPFCRVDLKILFPVQSSSCYSSHHQFCQADTHSPDVNVTSALDFVEVCILSSFSGFSSFLAFSSPQSHKLNFYFTRLNSFSFCLTVETLLFVFLSTLSFVFLLFKAVLKKSIQQCVAIFIFMIIISYREVVAERSPKVQWHKRASTHFTFMFSIIVSSKCKSALKFHFSFSCYGSYISVLG